MSITVQGFAPAENVQVFDAAKVTNYIDRREPAPDSWGATIVADAGGGVTIDQPGIAQALYGSRGTKGICWVLALESTTRGFPS